MRTYYLYCDIVLQDVIIRGPALCFPQPPSINNTNIDTLLVAADQQSEKAPPPEELQDKIHFLFNNLSSSNLQEKVTAIYLYALACDL